MNDVLKPTDFSSLTAALTMNVKIGEAISTLEFAVLDVRPHPPHRHREAPFSVTLSGPRDPLLPQGTYPVRHPELGVLQLFLVPASQDATSTTYEVTFN
ncbi:MAG: hypothetical protein IPI73_08515 [Betaproteobacteria bacterium]|nr:hypothetical protein [Betaproteobacteria bacterium]